MTDTGNAMHCDFRDIRKVRSERPKKLPSCRTRSGLESVAREPFVFSSGRSQLRTHSLHLTRIEAQIGVGKTIIATNFFKGDARSVLVQADGKIVLVGRACSGAAMCLARLNADGTLDPTLIGPNGAGNGTFNVSLPSNVYLEVISAALQPDGKILVGGNCGDNPPRFVLPPYRFCVSRFNTNGTWDLPFSNGTGSGQTGMMLLPVAPGNSYNRRGTIALQSDGKIVIAGGCSNPSGTSDPPNYTQSCVARLNANGSVDTTIGAASGAGWVLLPRLADPPGYGVYSPLSAIALQPDGKIIVAGICEGYGNAHKHCPARLNGANGALDASFVGPAGTGSGIFLLPINSNVPQLRGRVSNALQPNGKIVLAGYCSATGTGPDDQGLNHFDFCLARMLGNGAFDTSFVGPAGDAAGRFVMPVGGSEDFAFSMALQPNGRIVVAGGCIDTFNDAGSGPNPGTFDFCVVRFNSDGSIDQDFAGPRPTAGNSRYLLPVGVYDDFVNSVALQPDGKIVLAGACRDATSYFDFDFCVARLNGDAVTGSACMPDVDGDGNFLPMTDGLMLIRYALGLASDAVIAGINFPAGATRKTSSRIGGFLASLCGPGCPARWTLMATARSTPIRMRRSSLALRWDFAALL